MGRKKKNKKRNNQPTITVPENPPFIDGNETDNRQLIDNTEFSDTSSESGKSDFDDEYERNRPPPIPIDPFRIRRIKKPQISNNIEGDDNDNDINDMTIKVDKAQRRRSDDEICTPSTSNTQMETGINDDKIEETPNPIEFGESAGKMKQKSMAEKRANVTKSNGKKGKKKKHKKRSRRQKKQSSEDQQMPKLNHPKNNKLTRIQIDTVQYIEEIYAMPEFIALVDLTFTTKESYPRFLEFTETIKAADFQIDYVHIPVLVDTVDEVCNKQAENVGKKKNKKKKHCRECRKNTVQVALEKKSKFATNENCHLSYAEMLKRKLIKL